MLNLIKESFSSIIKIPSITLFLVIFCIFISFYLPYMSSVKNEIVFGILFICFFLLISVFACGWLNTINESTIQKQNVPKNYGGIFLEGIGKDIFAMTSSLFIYCILMFILFILVAYFAYKYFGDPRLVFADANVINQDNASILEYLRKLPEDKLFILYGWQIAYTLSFAIFNFIFLFFFPAFCADNKTNQFLKPLIAFKNSIVFLFKNFFPACFIYILINFTNMILGILSTFSSNFILSTIFLFIHIYFASFAIMLIFNYYEKKNNCPNGPNCIGENCPCNTISEEN